jgi:adenine phosphoribosyltransferase
LNVEEALRLIRDEGPPRADVTPLYANAEAFRVVVDELLDRTEGLSWNVVAGIDALGFVLGGALAAKTGRGMVPLRKHGKLPRPGARESFNHYRGGTEALEVRDGLLGPDDLVLVVDEWIETAATVAAAVRLIEGYGAKVAGLATLHSDVPVHHPALGGIPLVALNRL